MNWLRLNHKLVIALFTLLLSQNSKAQQKVQAIGWPNQTADTIRYVELKKSAELFNVEQYKVETTLNSFSILSVDRRQNIVLAVSELGKIEYYDLKPIKHALYTGNLILKIQPYAIGNVLEICAETRSGHSTEMGGASSVYQECAVLSITNQQIMFTYSKTQNADSWSYVNIPAGIDFNTIPKDSLEIEAYREVSEIAIEPDSLGLKVNYTFESSINEQFEGEAKNIRFNFNRGGYMVKLP
jgi:hypothetical protein